MENKKNQICLPMIANYVTLTQNFTLTESSNSIWEFAKF